MKAGAVVGVRADLTVEGRLLKEVSSVPVPRADQIHTARSCDRAAEHVSFRAVRWSQASALLETGRGLDEDESGAAFAGLRIKSSAPGSYEQCVAR
jgi:hypothetical protein